MDIILGDAYGDGMGPLTRARIGPTTETP